MVWRSLDWLNRVCPTAVSGLHYRLTHLAAPTSSEHEQDSSNDGSRDSSVSTDSERTRCDSDSRASLSGNGSHGSVGGKQDEGGDRGAALIELVRQIDRSELLQELSRGVRAAEVVALPLVQTEPPVSADDPGAPAQPYGADDAASSVPPSCLQYVHADSLRVRRIVGEHTVQGRKRYLVQWAGCDAASSYVDAASLLYLQVGRPILFTSLQT